MVKIVCKDFQSAVNVVRDYLNHGDYFTYEELYESIKKNRHFMNVVDNPLLTLEEKEVYG